MTPRMIRAVVVDDSAYVRKALREMLSRSPFIDVVGAAHNTTEALEVVARLKPDVVTMDLIMPGRDGVDFIRTQMATDPLPIVVVSSVDGNETRVLSALEAGAVDFLQKPTRQATDRLFDMATALIDKVKTAAEAPVPRLHALRAEAVAAPVVSPKITAGARRVDVVVIGVSTGGPQALRYLIPQLPANFPAGIAMVLHMPVGYTEFYARRLDDICALTVKEAHEGDELRAGVVLLAPGGQHLSLQRRADGAIVAHLDVEPATALHRPSVDVLFESAATLCDNRVLGVVMTGMGSDGREGAAWIKARGGMVLTEAEETCVVYGMPRAVVEMGLSDAAVPLDRLAAAIVECM